MSRTRRRTATVLGALLATAGLLLGTASPASASSWYAVVSGYNPSTYAHPSLSATRTGSLRSGQRVAIACTITGDWVSGPYGATNLWDYSHLENGYVSDAYIYTGTSGAVGPPCGGSQLHWDAPEANLGVEQPGTRRLYNELRANPAWNVRGGDRHFAGIYANKPGEHGEGRALDFWMDADNPAERQVGWNLAEFLRSNAGSYGIQTIIWNDRVWQSFNPGAGWQAYDEVANCGTGKTCRHDDHLHIGQNWAGAVLQTAHWGGPR